MTTAAGQATVLGDLLADLDGLADDATIFAAKPWTADSDAILVAGEHADGNADRDGLSYLLEVDLAREVAEVWSAHRAGRTPTTRELCRAVIYYATHDAWQPAEP